MSDKETDVLIVGAGPTGLTLAAALAKAGVRVHLVDKATTRSEQSRALALQAGTLESLNGTFGPSLSQHLVGQGHKVREGFLHLNGGKAVRLDLSLIPSTYDYILLLSQSETERLLEAECEQHSLKVTRSTELTALEDRGDHVVASLRNAAGQDQVKAQYVVGCDGAHSTVRHHLGFPFQGGAYQADFLLGDVSVEWKLRHGCVHAFSSGQGLLLLLPFGDEDRYRVITFSRNAGPATIAELPLKELQAAASRLCPNDLVLRNPTWLSRFRVHHRMTEKLREGRVFLAGDAAHIHSPLGGQGMNTGMQDALNLASKLSSVLKRGAKEPLLDDYATERLPIAKKVLHGTGFAVRLALLPSYFPLSLLRNWLLPVVLRSTRVQKRLFAVLSQVSIARREVAQRVDEYQIGSGGPTTA